MKTYLQGHEKGYSLAISKSDREKEGLVFIEILYRDNERYSVSVRTEDLINALKAFV